VDELVDLVAGRAVVEGFCGSSWPGLAFWRFGGPGRACDEVVESLSICVVVQGRQRVRLDGRACVCGPCDLVVLAQGERFVADVVEASGDRPLLAVVLRIDPAVAVGLHGEIERCSGGSPPPSPDAPPGSGQAEGGPLGREFAGALARFVRSTDGEVDRRVLAPLALREVTYRVLRAAGGAALAVAAHRENAGDRVAAAIAFMRDELARPIKVEDMAKRVSMSVSGFAHLFKEATGSAPYQYLKRLRLDRARALLVEENLAVGDACGAVGYGSVSHFVAEFRRHYGETPRAYAARLRRLREPLPPVAAR